MSHSAPSRGSCIDARAARDCERAAQYQRRRDAFPPVSVERKLKLALADDVETGCRLEHAVTDSFLHEERVLLGDCAEAVDGPAAAARRADVSFGWRAGHAAAERRTHPKHGLEVERLRARTRLRGA